MAEETATKIDLIKHHDDDSDDTSYECHHCHDTPPFCKHCRPDLHPTLICEGCHEEKSALHKSGLCGECEQDEFDEDMPAHCDVCTRPIEEGRDGHHLCTWDDGIPGNEIGPQHYG